MPCFMMGPKLRTFLGFILIVASSGWVLACQVPVFRYALERWMGDFYSIRIFTVDSGGEALDFLRKAITDADFPVNYSLEVLPPNEGDARMELRYPPKIRGADGKQVWSGPLTMENATRLVDSPCRRELIKRILSGHSVVWVFLKTGIEEKDNAARTSLESALAEAREKIPIPQGVVTAREVESEVFSGDPDDIVSDGIPLQIEFSMIEVSRQDPAEEIFIEMLLNLEDDLHELSDSTMVFPVFGRNRVLEPLVGAGINTDTVLDYSSYLCGACSCEVKDQNPGMDLLSAANWQVALRGTAQLREQLQVNNTVKIDAANSTDLSPSRYHLIYMGLGLLLLGVVALLFKRDSRKKK
jgi:hypothetical protein